MPPPYPQDDELGSREELLMLSRTDPESKVVKHELSTVPGPSGPGTLTTNAQLAVGNGDPERARLSFGASHAGSSTLLEELLPARGLNRFAASLSAPPVHFFDCSQPRIMQQQQAW